MTDAKVELVAKAIYDECRILNQEEHGGEIDRPFAVLDDKEREQMGRVARAAIAALEQSDAVMGEAGWQPIETAPHAMHVLATYFGEDDGEWMVSVVMHPFAGPWSHWRPLPAPPGSTPIAPVQDNDAEWLLKYIEQLREFFGEAILGVTTTPNLLSRLERIASRLSRQAGG